MRDPHELTGADDQGADPREIREDVGGGVAPADTPVPDDVEESLRRERGEGGEEVDGD